MTYHSHRQNNSHTMKTIYRTAICAFALATLALAQGPEADAQGQSTSTAVQRRTSGPRTRHGQGETNVPQVTQRQQAFYEDADAGITDADRQWMRIIYRQLDLDKDKNAPLYYPEENIDGQENLFRIIMRLLANNQIHAYEYLDGREIFTEQYQVKVRDLLDRFHIIYTEAKGSTERNPRFTIQEADVPTNEVLSYYIIERWEFDTRNNRMRTIVEAICPVLHRSGDFGGEAVKYPMFWVKFADLRPWLAQQHIFTSDDNNLPTCTYDDYFTQNMYEGEIYKTRNLKNKSLMQMYPDPEELTKAQDSIQRRLDSFESKLWVPDREEVIAHKDNDKDKKDKDEGVAADNSENSANSGEAVTNSEEKQDKQPKRSTKRSSKRPKSSKVKESKASKSASATRSVRRRK